MTKVTGVILAGGTGSRLGGVRKADIKVGGIPMIERVRASMLTQCDHVVIADGTVSPRARPAGTTVPDAPGHPSGPVSGLAGAVKWLQEDESEPDFLLTCAVDTPFFPRMFYEAAAAQLTAGTDVVFGCEDEQIFPTSALWRFENLTTLPERLLREEIRGFRAILPPDKTAVCAFPRGSFANINTLDDLLACQRRTLEIQH